MKTSTKKGGFTLDDSSLEPRYKAVGPRKPAPKKPTVPKPTKKK